MINFNNLVENGFGRRSGGCFEQNMSRLTSCLVQLRRKFEVDWGEELEKKKKMGAWKDPMEEICLLLIRSMLVASMEHVETTFQATREHVAASY